MRITLLAWGTRGDVQPCVALGIGLKRAGHNVRLCADDDYAPLADRYGLEFFPTGVHFSDFFTSGPAPSAGKRGRSPIGMAWQMMRTLRDALKELMEAAWQASQASDAILFSSIPIYGYHIAERLEVPCFWALSMPVFNRTRAWPNPVLPFPLPLGGSYNLLTHMFIEQSWQQLLGRVFNHWRRERLGLPSLSLSKWPYTELRGQPVTCFYHYSPLVMPKPPDWGSHIHVTGYWLLEHSSDWQPPASLLAFIMAGPRPIYVGFGSMSLGIRDRKAIVKLAVEALTRAGQRGVLAMGRCDLSNVYGSESVLSVGATPHDWLFPRMAAVVHHGGAGTTGAGLRAGIPNIVVPFMADQPFWGERVKLLGAGPNPIPWARLTAERLASAIREAINQRPMQERVAALGGCIRAEEGVARTVELIETQLSLA